MSDWHASNSADWTPIGSRMITGHGGGVGPYQASYTIDLASGPILNGSVSADIKLTESGVTGVGLVCRADPHWTFMAFYTAPESTSDDSTVARLSMFREGVLVPVAQLAEPVRLEPGFNHFSLEFFSGRARGEIRAGERTYELTATCPQVPFPGHAGLVKFYGAGVLARSWAVERTQLPFVPAASRRTEGQKFEYDVFLCHASETAKEVQAIADALADRGISYWLDRERIKFGDSVTKKIEEGLLGSHYLLPCISKDLTARGWTRAEIGSALVPELRGDSSRITIPLLLAEAEPDDIPPLLRDKRWVSSTNKVEFDEFVSFLLSH